MTNHLKRALLLLAFAAAAPLSAFADVTYTYTGNNFTFATAEWHLPRDLPPGAEEAESARIAAELLTSRMTVSITLPVYLPAGWTTFNYYEISSPGLVDAFTLLQDSHTVDHPKLGLSMAAGYAEESGEVSLQGAVGFRSYIAGSIFVDSNNQITEWNISTTSLNPDNSATFYSRTNDDWTSVHVAPGPHGSFEYYAHSLSPGSWVVSGNAVSVVPDAPAYATLLAGLGLLGALARRRLPGGRR